MGILTLQGSGIEKWILNGRGEQSDGKGVIVEWEIGVEGNVCIDIAREVEGRREVDIEGMWFRVMGRVIVEWKMGVEGNGCTDMKGRWKEANGRGC